MADPFSAFASDGFTNLIGGVESLIGGGATKGSSETTASSNTTSSMKGTSESRDRLEISDEAITKIVDDILSGPDGLASIFAGEQNAGIFNSSVAAQAAGDLTAQVAGEIAKLRAERVQTANQDQTQTQETVQESKTKTKQKKEGILDQLF